MSSNKVKSASVIFLIILTICLVLGANAWKSNLIVKQIKVEGNRIVSANEIIQLTQVPINSLLYKADLTSIQRNVTSHYYIKNAIVERNLPNTINIKVIERIPIAIINKGETLYLDEDGVILPRPMSRKIFDLPIISGIQSSLPVTLGASLKQEDIIESLKILMVLKKINRTLYSTISEVQVRNGGDIILYTTEGAVPIIFGRGEIPEKITLLETFWDNVARVQGPQNLKYVDLRYKDQIITVWNTETKSS